MYENIKGYLVSKDLESIVIGTPSFDYRVYCSSKLGESLDDGSENLNIPLHFKHDEKGMTLFGFIDLEERTMFNSLIKIPAIGCKVALRILSSVTPKELIQLKASRNIRQLCLIKGVSEKTAFKIIDLLKV